MQREIFIVGCCFDFGFWFLLRCNHWTCHFHANVLFQSSKYAKIVKVHLTLIPAPLAPNVSSGFVRHAYLRMNR